MTSWTKFGFYKLIECIIKKKSLSKKLCHGVKQNAKICVIGETDVMKLEVSILGGQRIDQKKKKGWWRGRRDRIEKGSRERIEKREKKHKGPELTI